jgi:hypothetical protein
MSDKLKLCSFRLLAEEKQYCASNGLTQLWKRAYASLILPVLLDKRIALGEKLSALDCSAMSYVLSFLVKRLALKAFRIAKNDK